MYVYSSSVYVIYHNIDLYMYTVYIHRCAWQMCHFTS